MARELNGAELAGFMKERQAYQVRNLKQEYKIQPRLLVLVPESASAVIDKYVGLKQLYGEDIGVAVDVVRIDEGDLLSKIAEANSSDMVHGIIVQLPLKDETMTDTIVDTIDPAKDVDGLGGSASYHSATAVAIDWLLAGYNIDLANKKIAIVGRGRLVGAPLEKLWSTRGYTVKSLDIHSKDTEKILRRSEVIVTATGKPRLITSESLQKNAVVVDAGTASENGALVGDVADDVRERKDISITPKIGGVGPMTVAVLFDHVVQAALKVAGKL